MHPLRGSVTVSKVIGLADSHCVGALLLDPEKSTGLVVGRFHLIVLRVLGQSG